MDASSAEPQAQPTATRAGYVTLLGLPNAGKSTLLNTLVGQRLAIVSARAQSTWRRVTGIVTTDDTQLIFLDTPGVLQPRDLLQRSLLAQAREALREADVVVMVIDATDPGADAALERLAALASEASGRLLVVLNKVDRASEGRIARAEAWVADRLDLVPLRVSALRGQGVAELMEGASALLPPAPFLYPADEIASQPVRFFVGELVRETVFERFRQEIPYSVFTQVEEFRQGEEGERTYIQVHIFVERASQKGILIGEGGTAIRELGRAAREKIEHFLEGPVYLDLWVKVLPGWRRKRGHLRRLGFSIPEDDGTP